MNVIRGFLARAAVVSVVIALAFSMNLQRVTAQEADAGAAAGVPEPADVLVTNVFFDTFIVDALSDLSLQTGIPILRIQR